MDQKHTNKKRPFGGRDGRSGRSFFRTRREEALRNEEEAEEERGDERTEGPVFKDFRNDFKKKGPKKEFKQKEFGPRRDATRSEGERPEGMKKRAYDSDKREPYSKNKNNKKQAYSDKRSSDEGWERRRRYEESAQAMPAEMRLNRFIAMSGVCSRREADQLIEAGEVTVNGVRVDQLGSKVRPGKDEVRLNGELLKGEKKVYIILNKPKGYVTTVDDPHADRTVIDLLKGECKERVYPVGRLDKNTTGVLLLTNDGNLTKELTHPSYNKKKIYHVFLDKPCSEEDIEKLTAGIELEDGPIRADEVSWVEGNMREVGVELHSGRNRIVRRMFEALGYEVVKLDRVYFAGLTKMGLRRGFWRYLTPREVGILKSNAYD